MAIEFADVYRTILFLNILYLIVLLYGGIWYTNRQTVECPRCGVKYSESRFGSHTCHPSLLGDDTDGA